MPPQVSTNSVSPSAQTSFPILHVFIILVLFLLYGSAVRKGILRGGAILGAGVVVGLIAVAIYSLDMLPLYQRGASLYLVAMPPLTMAGLSAFCVAMSYHQQRVRDLATHTVGDSKIILRVCPAILIPDADALVLPVGTSLRGIDQTVRAVLNAAGPQVTDALAKQGPVGLGKVVATVGGALAVGQIFHVAVADATHPIDASRLKRGVESGAQQARKAGAESIALPLGPVVGLSATDNFTVPIDALLRQRKAFAEIVFVVVEPRTARLVQPILAKAIAQIEKPEAASVPVQKIS